MSNIQSLATHLQSNQIHIIDIHNGNSTCIIVKSSNVNRLYELTNQFPNIDVLNILSGVTDVYQYIFIAHR